MMIVTNQMPQATPEGSWWPDPMVRRAVMPLGRGHVALEFPAQLTAQEHQDMEVWLEVLLRVAGRSVRAEAAGTSFQDSEGAEHRE